MEWMAAFKRVMAGASRNPARAGASILRYCLLLASFGLVPVAPAQELPDSPGALMSGRVEAEGQFLTPHTSDSGGQTPQAEGGSAKQPLCPASNSTGSSQTIATSQLCRRENPIQPIVTAPVKPLSVRQKGDLAFRDAVDPFNLLTIAGYSGIAVAANPQSAYGPGLYGWGRLSGYSFIEDAQGEFFGTFLISSITHEDPRYHRMPQATFKRRILHALAHTWVSQHDDGSRMPNYATLLNYPASAELSNLYVPGVPTRLSATARRVAVGLATDPSGTLVAEFLPDLARRIHVHSIFLQEILNQVVTGGMAPNVE